MAAKMAAAAAFGMRHFTGRFRNFMQSKQWPAWVTVTRTSEAKTIINQDGTLLRRTEPIEVLPMTFNKDGTWSDVRSRSC
ncbi:hypothetical protein KUV51_17275 [Tateyamaria omphalii]|uniref:hypothetical protein n=1 Tax=Tateyamaria omphalii TaxID=299262 RepID=UPI001C9A2717|nr:hypothetical protein [Tateyamaria omphalii]MBY5934762.1 hypothetical protein [Tateyamaria omphalii]